jgi:hypothetical protein
MILVKWGLMLVKVNDAGPPQIQLKHPDFYREKTHVRISGRGVRAIEK